MVYFDNAATGGFKPARVIDTATEVMRYLTANPGRSGHRLSVIGLEKIVYVRNAVGNLFNAKSDRVIFTKNCTEALNLAIFGTLNRGDHVISTTLEHNSVLRPLKRLENLGVISLDIVDVDDVVDSITRKINKNTKAVITTALSNVTGELLPIRKIGELCKNYNLKYIVDGAQAGGHIPIDIVEDKISLLALAGHKGLYGIMGSGVLVADQNTTLTPLIYGGTGTESKSLTQPQFFPEGYESGTLNLPAICALGEGVDYVSKNLNNFSAHLTKYTKKVIDGLSTIKGTKIYSNPNPAGIVSFALNNMDSDQVCDVLNRDFDLAVRGGYHCAPLTHKRLNTLNGGLVRVSVAVQNTSSEIDYFLSALSKIANG